MVGSSSTRSARISDYVSTFPASKPSGICPEVITQDLVSSIEAAFLYRSERHVDLHASRKFLMLIQGSVFSTISWGEWIGMSSLYVERYAETGLNEFDMHKEVVLVKSMGKTITPKRPKRSTISFLQLRENGGHPVHLSSSIYGSVLNWFIIGFPYAKRETISINSFVQTR
jgi:hypothetical protein